MLEFRALIKNFLHIMIQPFLYINYFPLVESRNLTGFLALIIPGIPSVPHVIQCVDPGLVTHWNHTGELRIWVFLV
jgi:hypothetical protein